MRGAKRFCIALILLLCTSRVEAGSPDRMVPLSIDRVRVLAAAYAHRYICICATADQPMWRGDYWEVAIDTTELSHSSGFVRIDRRTGEISYPGQPSASIGEVEEWLKSQRTGRRGAKK